MNQLSICINTAANELSHLQLLFRSLYDNLHYDHHEIIVFIDSDNENTYEWLLSQQSRFKNLKILRNVLPICYGYARNINEMFKVASHKIVSYLQSDMVISKDYDLHIFKHINPRVILSSTRIEPPLHDASPQTHTVNFGLTPTEFDYTSFLEYAANNSYDKQTNYFFAPFTLYKDVWNSIGGHDTQFRRSREDSDILNRLILSGNSIIQTWDALVYHFTCTSSRGKDWFNPSNSLAQSRVLTQQIADNIEMGRFLRKWGKFSHSTSKPIYYKVNANIRGSNVSLRDFRSLEIFFDTVYVEDTSLISSTQQDYDRHHTIANELLNITPQAWKKYSYIYNCLKAPDRIKPLSHSRGPIIVDFNIHDIQPEQAFSSLLELQDLIHEESEGSLLNIGALQLTINSKKDNAEEKTIVRNPKVKIEDKYVVS